MKIPPEHLRIRLYGSFKDPDVWIEVGLYSFHRLRDAYHIESHHKIIDLGCGCGRLVLPLISFLDSSKGGAYYGLDVDKEMMDWCAINFNYSNFHFMWADVKNSLYFRTGQLSDALYKFPYEDNLLDFGCAFSLFTHLLEAGSVNYLNETSRVLKPNGKLMFSCFLFDDITEANIAAGKSAWTFKYNDTERCRYDIQNSPDCTVGYTLKGMQDMITNSGLKLVSIIKGNWSEVPNGSHDEVLVEKI